MNKNKRIIILFGVIVIVIISGYFSYQYWRKGTPEYSIQQLQKSMMDHNANGALRFFDTDSVANNIWPRYKVKYQTLYSFNYLTSAYIDSQEKDFKEVIKNAWYDLFRGQISATTTISGTMNTLFNDKNNFIINNGTVTKNITYQKTDSDLKYEFNFVLEQQSNRSWRIIDIQGFEDFTIKSVSQNDNKVNAPESQSSPPSKKTWHTVYTITTGTSKNTSPFTIKGNQWRVVWDCKSSEGTPPTVYARPSNGYGSDKIATPNSCPSNDTTYLYDGPGTFYLEISIWSSTTITVTIEDYY